jgi:hypothetical protein
MENSELDLLLTKNSLYFHWSEVTRTWQLSFQKKIRDNPEGSQSHSAVNVEAAQAAAVQALKALPRPEKTYSEEGPQLDSLLNKYRLTFNWANPGLKWWLVGQNKNTNALSRTVPQAAGDIETAKLDAVRYILARYEPAPQDIEESNG